MYNYTLNAFVRAQFPLEPMQGRPQQMAANAVSCEGLAGRLALERETGRDKTRQDIFFFITVFYSLTSRLIYLLLIFLSTA